MPACTSISKVILFILALTFMSSAHAQAPVPGPGGVPAAGSPAGTKKGDEPGLFDQSTPYLEYGDFNMNEDDDADTLYFQYGRFFGVSVGLGYETATGNRGLLYTPAFPRFDLEVHYWFDFQLAMTMGIFFASHTYEYSTNIYNVKLIGYGLNLKYYFDVRNASAALTFSNPFLTAGVGAISKTESTSSSTTPGTDSTFSVNFGGGLEFPISYKKTYFILEAKYHTQSFIDSGEDKFKTKGIGDLSGGFFTFMAHILFTW